MGRSSGDRLLYQLTKMPATLAWREQAHDDLLLAMSLCTWWGAQQAHYLAGIWGA